MTKTTMSIAATALIAVAGLSLPSAAQAQPIAPTYAVADAAPLAATPAGFKKRFGFKKGFGFKKRFHGGHHKGYYKKHGFKKHGFKKKFHGHGYKKRFYGYPYFGKGFVVKKGFRHHH